jgi:hypothetical protein
LARSESLPNPVNRTDIPPALRAAAFDFFPAPGRGSKSLCSPCTFSSSRDSLPMRRVVGSGDRSRPRSCFLSGLRVEGSWRLTGAPGEHKKAPPKWGVRSMPSWRNARPVPGRFPCLDSREPSLLDPYEVDDAGMGGSLTLGHGIGGHSDSLLETGDPHPDGALGTHWSPRRFVRCSVVSGSLSDLAQVYHPHLQYPYKSTTCSVHKCHYGTTRLVDGCFAAVFSVLPDRSLIPSAS